MEDDALEKFVAETKLKRYVSYSIIWHWSDWIDEEPYGWMKQKETDKGD